MAWQWKKSEPWHWGKDAKDRAKGDPVVKVDNNISKPEKLGWWDESAKRRQLEKSTVKSERKGWWKGEPDFIDRALGSVHARIMKVLNWKIF